MNLMTRLNPALRIKLIFFLHSSVTMFSICFVADALVWRSGGSADQSVLCGIF